MLRTIRCRDCGNRYYANTENPVELCQNCTGDHDPLEQLKADAKVVRKANARPKTKAQSVDPRNPTLPLDPEKDPE
jgi:predicted  nucleic acid-binding Zn-ribbon protein